jgi:hypothetical protein
VPWFNGDRTEHAHRLAVGRRRNLLASDWVELRSRWEKRGRGGTTMS